MSNAKPLSAERRAEILEHMQLDQWGNAVNLPMIEDILAAEEYWREAVKNANAEAEGVDGGYCVFCTGDDGPTEDHKPDCAWKLAQEEGV